MARGHVEFGSLNVEAQDSYGFAGVSAGLRGRVLSRDADTGGHTARLDVMPLWRWQYGGYFRSDLELLVLQGAIQFGASQLQAGTYAFIPAGQHLSGLESRDGCVLLFMSAAESEFVESQKSASFFDAKRAMAPVDVRALPWSAPPGFEGRAASETIPGLGVKWLREDAETTAYTLLSRHAPGWADPRIEAHDTWEELILLDGDYLMGDTGIVEAGTYIFRPGERPHGPQATHHGAVWFCRGERRIDFQLQSPPWAADRVAQYSAWRRTNPSTRHAPWGDWLQSERL